MDGKEICCFQNLQIKARIRGGGQQSYVDPTQLNYFLLVLGIYAVWFHEKEDSKNVFRVLNSCLGRPHPGHRINSELVKREIIDIHHGRSKSSFSSSNHRHQTSGLIRTNGLNGSILNLLNSADCKVSNQMIFIEITGPQHIIH